MAEVNDPYYNYLQKTSSAESSGNPYAKAKTSSASGLYQFTDSTWKEVVNKHNLGYTLNDRFNPEKAEKVMRLFTQDNEKQLKPILGRELTDSERYLGHFLGIKDAGNLFKAYKKDENMPVDYYVSPKALQANKGVFYNKDGSIKTTKQVYDWANKKMGDSPTYANSVAPYINQNIDFSNSAEGITFEEEKPEKETEATQALKVLQEKQKEEDFLTELFSEQEQKIAELYKPIEEEQDSQPQSYDYNDISNFVESPILAQQGIKIDNMGYWNPQNWGQPVQINSNNITMEGVEQPLMGYAPETGEKRLMMPNTNHIFNGANRVIETPLTDKEKQFLKEITRIK